MIPRFHIPFPLSPGAQVALPEGASHHALKVLRLREGAGMTLFDGSGGEWQASLKVDAGGTAHAVLKTFVARDCESPLTVTLVQALPAGDKMDWIVEKCAELGVVAIQPLAAKRSVIKLSGERLTRRVAHWNAVAAAACEQCGRNRVPTVAPVLDLPQYLALARGDNAGQNAVCLLLTPDAGQALQAQARPAGPVVVMAGPEGGWEESEVLAARVAGWQAVRLGPRVLRTETAGMAALAAMQALWGDF